MRCSRDSSADAIGLGMTIKESDRRNDKKEALGRNDKKTK
jgi:hypothetical protein